MVIPAAPTAKQKESSRCLDTTAGSSGGQETGGHTSKEPHKLTLGWRVPTPEGGTRCVSFSALLIHEVVGLKNTLERIVPSPQAVHTDGPSPIRLVFQILKIHSGKRIYHIDSNMVLSPKSFQVLKCGRFCSPETRAYYTHDGLRGTDTAG